MAIPDAILLKPGPLTAEERAIVETHAEEGHRLLRGSSSSILDMAATIALSHHEKWDGSGYPRGLAGEAIPIEGRIVAVADVFDALTCDRVYRYAFTLEQAVEMMREQRGRHFDPVLLDAFLEVLDRTGPDAREQLRSDPQALLEGVLETYLAALERGDAETAEGRSRRRSRMACRRPRCREVIAPALRRMASCEQGEIDAERERAAAIARRVLATLYRYMLGGAEPTRERVLLASVEGDRHTLGLQMVHDQSPRRDIRRSTKPIDRRAAAAIESRPDDELGATSHALGVEASSARRCPARRRPTRRARQSVSRREQPPAPSARHIDFRACPIARSSPAEPASSAPTSWTPYWPTATR